MANLESVLARIPGYGGFLAKSQYNQQQEAGQIQQARSLMQIAQAMQAQQEQKALEGTLQGADNPEAAIKALLATGKPQAIELASKLKGMQPKPEGAVSIGSGGLRLPDGTVVPPAARPEQTKPEAPSPLGRLLQERDSLPEGDPRRQVYDAAIKKTTDSVPAGDRPFYSPVQTAAGTYAFNGRTGRLELAAGPDGKPVVAASADPLLKWRMAASAASGKEIGEAGTKAQIDLPTVEDKSAMTLQQVDALIGSKDGKIKPHEGFKSYIGMTLRPGARFVDGTPEASFKARLDQLMGGAFLEAFQALKGGGQITEVEGTKATAAITRMSKTQSEAEFIAAAREFQQIVQQGLQRARNKARLLPPQGGAGAAPAASTPNVVDFGSLK